MTDINDVAGMWLTKMTGALAGSAISIAYVLPEGRREAAIRFAVGVVCGVVFGSTIGVKFASELGVLSFLTPSELVLMGSAVASLFAWSGIGFIQRLLQTSGFSKGIGKKAKD